MMAQSTLPELWEWAEYYCPWCYITSVRLHTVAPEYAGRVRLRIRAFPLEVVGGEAAPRDILEQEWWLAAVQEPSAPFVPYTAPTWPTTTLPAFEAVRCAGQQSEEAAQAYDLRVRRAFFGESRDISQREVLLEIARDIGLDLPSFTRAFDSGSVRESIVQEGHEGKQRYGVRGTPTLMLADGTKLEAPLAEPKMRRRKIIAVGALPCHGAGCLEATRDLFEQAVHHA
jgi:predicted DsbA family dithiol-disulfide isomerase